MNTCGCNHHDGKQMESVMALAIATVPTQPWVQPYDPATSLKRGTIFPNLYLPFYVGGEENG